MKKQIIALIVLTVVVLTHGCGKKGPIYAPLEKIPEKISLFRGFQRGGAFVLQWENSNVYIDGSPMDRLSAVEFWLLRQTKEPEALFGSLSTQEFTSDAQLYRSLSAEELSRHLIDMSPPGRMLQIIVPVSLKEIGTVRYAFGVKVIDFRRKYSDLSTLVLIEPLAAPSAPNNLKAEVESDRIRLSWDPPVTGIDGRPLTQPVGYFLYRSEGGKETVPLGSELIAKPEFDDRRFEFGLKYKYYVRAAAGVTRPYLESTESNSLDILPEDIFPPRAPQGLTVLAGDGFVTLSWDPNRENDLEGYRIYRRKLGEDEFQSLTPDWLSDLSFIDRGVEAGERYLYSITARDSNGNESLMSPPTEVSIRGG